MSSGAPVVASKVGGLVEVVEDGVSGHLLPVGAVDEMADAGVRLLTDLDHRRKVVEAARERAVTHFSASAVASRYEALYTRVLSGANP
jgi:starch synthase